MAALEWFESVLGAGRSLYQWAAADSRAKPLLGRGRVHVIPAAVVGHREAAVWAVRHYHRGGAAAAALGDRYPRVGEPRPMSELRTSVEARARGVRTPAVVAGAVYVDGPFYRADLITELVPDSVSLARAVFSDQGRAEPISPLRAAGRLVRSLEEAGVRHADLNAHNVLLSAGADGPVAHVIDLDRCRVLPAPARRRGRSMRRRLVRSLSKLAREHARPLSATAWEALREGLGEPP